MRPGKFAGKADAMEAEEWIKSLETIYTYLGTPERYKVDCAAFQFTHAARTWWQTTSMTVDVAQLTWAQFKEIFEAKYVPSSLKIQRASEFLSLV